MMRIERYKWGNAVVYYRLGKRMERVSKLPDQREQPYVALLGPQELEQAGAQLGFNARTVRECGRVRITKTEVHSGYLFGTILVPARRGKSRARFPVGFYIQQNLLILVDETGEAEQALHRLYGRKKWEEPPFARVLYDFLEYLIGPDLLFLEEMEEQLTQMEDAALNGELDRFDHRMMAMRKELLYLHSYYEELIDLGDALQENENGFLGETEIPYFKLFTKRVERLSSNVQMLREYSMQVREVYQAQVDIKQNQIMKVLTVVTTLFLPLSLIAGWYGMNFVNMPELHWPFGYPLVIAASALVVGVCIWIFRRKKFF